MYEVCFSDLSYNWLKWWKAECVFVYVRSVFVTAFTCMCVLGCSLRCWLGDAWMYVSWSATWVCSACILFSVPAASLIPLLSCLTLSPFPVSITEMSHKPLQETEWLFVFFRLVSQWLLQDFYSHRSTGQGDSKVRIIKTIAEMLQLALIPKHTFCYLFPKITESTIQLQFYCTIYILSIQSSFGDNEVTFLVW